MLQASTPGSVPSFFEQFYPLKIADNAKQRAPSIPQKAVAPREVATVSVGSVADQLCAMLAEMLGFAVATDLPLMQAGLDSLGKSPRRGLHLSAWKMMSADRLLPRVQWVKHSLLRAGTVELRNSIGQKFQVDVPATLVFDYPTVTDIARYLAGRLAPGEALAAGGANKQQAPSRLHASEVLAQLQSIVADMLGSAVASDLPLMQAGLDSLGEWHLPESGIADCTNDYW